MLAKKIVQLEEISLQQPSLSEWILLSIALALTAVLVRLSLLAEFFDGTRFSTVASNSNHSPSTNLIRLSMKCSKLIQLSTIFYYLIFFNSMFIYLFLCLFS